jgi:hypothetical protein
MALTRLGAVTTTACRTRPLSPSRHLHLERPPNVVKMASAMVGAHEIDLARLSGSTAATTPTPASSSPQPSWSDAPRRSGAVVHHRDQRGAVPSNPLGLRGGGEGGTSPALGAAVNAIVDALAPLGVEHLEMPVTPERVWDAIRAAQRGRAASQSCSGGTRAST